MRILLSKMPGQHAILSPSSASRWLACTPSARVEQKFPENTSQAADEGTLAHALGELLIRNKNIGWILPKDFKSKLEAIKADKLYANEMMEYAENYAVFVMERFSEGQARSKDAILYLEQKLNLTRYMQEAFGTSDSGVIADGILDVVDLKYGKGVPVSAVNNTQMKVYALGVLEIYDMLYDIHTIRMTIYQPRLDSISTWEISYTELITWANNVLIPDAKLAFAGEGEFVPGNHCMFCRAKGICRALAEKNLEIEQYEFRKEDFLTPEDVADILTRANLFKNWLGGVEKYALAQALAGKNYPGFKMVRGKSNRIYSDEVKVAEILIKGHSIEENTIYAPKKLIGIGDMEKEIGKNAVFNWLSDYILKPQGAPTLAPEDDKRPAINSAESAATDFADIIEQNKAETADTDQSEKLFIDAAVNAPVEKPKRTRRKKSDPPLVEDLLS